MTDLLAGPPIHDLPRPVAAPYPLPFPALGAHGGVFVPTQGSYLVWRHLYAQRIGAGQRCLDVGCGSGLQAIQLARNGATWAHAIDVEPSAAAATIANAHRNGVGDRVSAATVDLLTWEPEERYDVVVASLYQVPADPWQSPAAHRPADEAGREAVDHLIGLLGRLLAPGGRAYVMQLSVLSRRRTDELLAFHGLQARTVDFAFYEFGERFRRHAAQIERAERRSDAHHLLVAGEEVMLAYLLEIERIA